MKIEKTVYVTLDTGTYDATVEAVSESEGNYGPQLVWDFQLDNMDVKKRAWSSQVMSPKSKLTRWTRALLGGVPDEIETGHFIGRRCKLSILTKTGDDGEPFNRVDEVLPLRAAPMPTAAPVPMPLQEANAPMPPMPEGETEF